MLASTCSPCFISCFDELLFRSITPTQVKMARIVLSKIPTVAGLIASGKLRTPAKAELAEQAAAVAHRVGLLQG